MQQPLYVENGPNAREAFIVATEENHVTALGSAGNVIWIRDLRLPGALGSALRQISVPSASRARPSSTRRRAPLLRRDDVAEWHVGLQAPHSRAISSTTAWRRRAGRSTSNIVTGASSPHHKPARRARSRQRHPLHPPWRSLRRLRSVPRHGGRNPGQQPAGAKYQGDGGSEGGIWSTGGTTRTASRSTPRPAATRRASRAGGEAIVAEGGPDVLEASRPTSSRRRTGKSSTTATSTSVARTPSSSTCRAPRSARLVPPSRDANLYIGKPR